jgi:hypothetical protein
MMGVGTNVGSATTRLLMVGPAVGAPVGAARRVAMEVGRAVGSKVAKSIEGATLGEGLVLVGTNVGNPDGDTVEGTVVAVFEGELVGTWEGNSEATADGGIVGSTSTTEGGDDV